MAKAALSVIARPAQYLVSRQAECFTATPANALRTWQPDSIEMSVQSGAAFLKTLWNPDNYAYGKDDYQVAPDPAANKALWIEGNGALGRGDKSIGFAGNASYPASTPWVAFLDTTHVIGQNRGVVLSFLWYRPADDTMPGFVLYPRLDHTRTYGSGGGTVYFTPFKLTIDQQMRLNVWEYPHDNYTAFETNPLTSLTKQYTHPLRLSPEVLASRWHCISIIPMSDEDVLISSDILEGGGFVYRSAMDREKNIFLLPEGVAGIQSTVGGTGQIQVTPLETASTGTLTSPVFSKSLSNAVYPVVSVFGWSPALIATDRGLMTNQTIASGATGTGGIKYDIYSVVTVEKAEILTLVDPSGGVEFKDFKIVLTLTPSTHVSPVINDVVIDYGEDTGTVADPTTDISNDVMQLSGQVSDDGNVRFNVKVRNQDNVYNSLAQRIMNELDVDIDGEDFVILYTLNPGFDWLKTPTQGALELNWETGDGMVYLQKELCARHPAYDGQLLSTALTEFMGRLGYDASRLDIDVTDGTIGGKKILLPKKMGKDPYQFKPEDGTPAADFLKKLKEWFGPTHTMGFRQDGVFQFKYIPVVGGLEVPTIHRTYYPLSTSKPTSDDHVVYRDAKVELVMDDFRNEIWVVGEDKRKNQPLIAVYKDEPSQTDKNSPKYVGRRLLMLMLTKCNTLEALTGICERLAIFYGEWDVRLTFNTRLDPILQKDDFIKLHGVAATWRVKDINYEASDKTMASTTINSGTPVIAGMSLTCVQWPVYW